MGIKLHKKLGINARMSKQLCVICHEDKDANSLLLLGNENQRYACNNCGSMFIGAEVKEQTGSIIHTRQCPKCEKKDSTVGEILNSSESVKIGGFQVCGDCRRELSKELGKGKNIDNAVFVVEITDNPENKEQIEFTGVYTVIDSKSEFIKENNEFIHDDIMLIKQSDMKCLMGESNE